MRTLTVHTADELATRWKRRAMELADSCLGAGDYEAGMAQGYRVAAAELQAICAVSMEMEAAHHGDPEGLPCFAARPQPQGDREAAKQGSHGGHHDRAEPDQRSMVNGRHRIEPLGPLGLQSEINHHDAVLFDNPDQHDDPDVGVHIEFHVENGQGRQGAKPGQGQRG